MTFYPAPNPYRASTGSMPIRAPHSPNMSKFEETCDSCGSSYTDEHLLHINTPFSGTPRTSAASLHPPSPHSHRHRRVSNSGIEPGQVLTRYHNGALVLEPATSYEPHGGERRRRSSISAQSPASIPRSHTRRSFASYQQEIDIQEANPVRRGTTRFPRKLVNKEAVQQAGLPFEEVNGTIIVLKALPRPEIEQLVELTETIRARRHHSHSHSHSHHKHTENHLEKHVRILTTPTETIETHRRHRRESFSGSSPQIIHHYVEDPRHSSHRLSRAEEAAAAADRARRKEYQAESSGNWLDGRRADRKGRRTKEDIIVR
ncbi:hypothetical protein EV426DRAFT_593727 [Tirmania nivea]|nr:hypothetical protein EV426DRAFT_593727 [Tirmania nivea]